MQHYLSSPSTPGQEFTSSPKQQYSPHPGDEIMSSSNLRSPGTSTLNLPSLNASALNLSLSSAPSTLYFRSRRLKQEDIPRPSTKDVKKSLRIWYWLFPIIGLILGLAVTGFKVYISTGPYFGLSYCPVLIEDFSSPTLDSSIWTREVQVGGFGNGGFEQTTADAENVFINTAGNLVIKPTLQDESLLTTNYTLNLLGNGCTSTSFFDCVAATNTTNGTIISPVKSGRINTKLGASIKFGRVEVVAKLPVGDWLWPAIWMLPTTSIYGAWPASGEIDIMESRGNNYTYPTGGNNVVLQTTHWGPSPDFDMSHITNAGLPAQHATYPSSFHIFGMQWNEKYIFTYVDSRVQQVLYQKFDKPAIQRGDFPKTWANGTMVVDVWANATDAAPFDQDFYLILSLAVGGTNGWFKDGLGGKAWSDNSATAKLEFWNDRANWYPTWKEQGQMEIQSVKMWQQKGYNGCQ